MKTFILAVASVIAAAPLFAATPTDSLANLIQSGDHKAALARIRAGADVNEAQPDGTRPIHWAVYQVDYDVLDALIAKKANVNVRNQFGSTPIAEAAKLADARLVKTLLAAGAEPEGVNDDGQTALMLAIKTGALPVVDMLIGAGANVNAIEKFRNQTPLMWAVSAPKNAAEMTKLLLAKGANVKLRALYTDWPSQITSEPRAQYRPVGGLTALLYAARDGCYDCVNQLIAAGADVNLPTPEGVTALMLALDNEHNDVAKLLLDKGANPNLWDWWGRSALYIAIDRKEAAATGRGGAKGGVATAGSAMDIINKLLAKNVDLNTQLNMHRPSRGGNSGRFGDPLLSTGCTPLMRATIANDTELIKLLLDKGANPNINDMGSTPFLAAAGAGGGGRGASAAGGLPLMQLFIDHGADINAQVSGTKTYSMRVSRSPSSNEGMTALHIAAQQGRADVVKYLLDKGANPDLADINGHKPIDLVGQVTPVAGGAGGGRGGAARGAGTSSATITEIKTMLEAAAAKK